MNIFGNFSENYCTKQTKNKLKLISFEKHSSNRIKLLNSQKKRDTIWMTFIWVVGLMSAHIRCSMQKSMSFKYLENHKANKNVGRTLFRINYSVFVKLKGFWWQLFTYFGIVWIFPKRRTCWIDRFFLSLVMVHAHFHWNCLHTCYITIIYAGDEKNKSDERQSRNKKRTIRSTQVVGKKWKRKMRKKKNEKHPRCAATLKKFGVKN